jgi:hypothetical protein
MTIRLLSVTAALLTGLLAVFLLDLALGASGAVAQEKKNCPAGFNWVRLSGIGCVQEQLPSHGKIGYDGTSICEDGYSGTYERRATTDGQPAPGTPYTSFAYLEECTSTAIGAGAIGGGAFSGTAGDVAEELYDGGGGPSPGELAGAGVLIAGAATLAATGGRIRGGWGRAKSYDARILKWYDGRIAELGREIAKAEQELADAEKIWEKTKEKLKDVQRVADSLRRQQESIRQLLEQARLNARDLDQAWWLRTVGAVILGTITVAQIATATMGATFVTTKLPWLARAIQASKLPALWAKVAAAIEASKIAALIKTWRWIAGTANLANTGAWGLTGWSSSKPWHVLKESYEMQLKSVNAMHTQAEQLDSQLQDAFRQKNKAHHKLLELQRERNQLMEWRKDFYSKAN